MKTTFLDTEEMSQALRHTNVKAMQVSRGKYRASLSLITAGEWSLQYITFEEGASVCAGDAPRDRHAVLVPLTQSPGSRLLGRPLEPGTVGVYAPGSEHADTTTSGQAMAVIVTPIDFPMRAELDGLGLVREGSHLHGGSSPALASLQDLLRCIRQARGSSKSERECVAIEASISDTLYRQITGCLHPASEVSRAVSCSVLGRPRMPRPAILRRISEILREREKDPIFACELAAEVGISQPSLQRVFHELFGMPPARYLGLRRLYLARQRLRQGGTTVTEVAGSYGFWDQSRFLRSYKAVFGELPSETLRGRRS